MNELTAGELAALAGATLLGDAGVRVGPDVVIDSRLVTPGALFVALPGERVDGHDFAATAVGRGAAAVLVGRDLGLGVPQLVVDDPQAGLSALASGLVAAARASGLHCIALTGSSGKTSTKDLLAAMLRAAGTVVAPVGSFNNEIGVPLTATRVDAGTDFLVSEMGSRAAGDIRALCALVPPEVGLVLNVGHAHLGEFGSVAGIAQAKGELVEALTGDGWAVLNADDPLVLGMASRTAAHLATFSATGRPETGELRVWASEVVAGALQRYSFTLHAMVSTGSTSGGGVGSTSEGGVGSTSEGGVGSTSDGEVGSTSDGGVGSTSDLTAAVSLLVSGAHQVGNALAAAAVGLIEGMGIEVIAAALSQAAPASRWRMELHERADGLLVVNDAYNANPDSMTAALTALAGLRREGGRLLAVLGDMLELGPDSAQQHVGVGELAGRLGVDAVIAVGQFAPDLVAGAVAAGASGLVVADRDAALAAALIAVSPADVVLVKASRGLALETVAEGLASDAELQEGQPA